MSERKRLFNLFIEAKKLESSLKHKYLNDYGGNWNKIARLVTRSGERKDRRREAYITECLRVEPAEPPVEGQLDTTELNAQWPSLENMPDGVDMFSQYPVSE